MRSGPHKVLNLGFGGDWTQNALWNVRYGGFLDDVKARDVTPEKRRQLLPDGTHPDAEAYAKWREALAPFLSR